MASIKLKRTVRASDPALYMGYSMIVETENAVDMPEEIFVFQRGIAPARSQQDPVPTDQFIKVAAPVDLEDYPPSPDDVREDMPFYRAKDVELWFRTEEERDEVWEYIQDDVAGLVNFLNNHLDEDFTEEVTIP